MTVLVHSGIFIQRNKGFVSAVIASVDTLTVGKIMCMLDMAFV